MKTENLKTRKKQKNEEEGCTEGSILNIVIQL